MEIIQKKGDLKNCRGGVIAYRLSCLWEMQMVKVEGKVSKLGYILVVSLASERLPEDAWKKISFKKQDLKVSVNALAACRKSIPYRAEFSKFEYFHAGRLPEDAQDIYW